MEIFRAGNYGAKGTYTPGDLQQIASGYDRTKHEAPLVIGHPKTDAPAFGWCQSLRAEGDKLFGTFDQVPAAIDQAVKDGRYKKRSVAITRTPEGKLMLRHVGLLGAMVPGVTGMADAKFGEEQFEEIEFSDNPGESMAADEQQQQERNAFMDRLMKFFSGDKGATQQIDLDKLKADLKTEFAATQDTKLAALQTEFADYKKAHEKTASQAQVDGAINRLKSEGKWLPAFDKMHVPALFAAVAAGSTVEIEFADDKGATQKLPTLDALSALVGGISKFVPRGVTFDDAKVVAAAADAAVAVEVNGGSADPGSVAFDRDIRARAKADNVSYNKAFEALTREGKTSASYATASAGAV